MKALIAIAIILIGLALVASISKRNKPSGSEPVADLPTPTAVQPVNEPAALPAPVQINSNAAPATVEEIASIYRRVVEKVEAAQKPQ